MSRLTVSFESFRGFWREMASRVTVRRDTFPIDSVSRLADFVAARAAFIAQKTLYGYLKTRIGTRYPRMFEDRIFVQSINIAKMHVFAACLSDLTIHAVARATHNRPVSDAARHDMAVACYGAGMDANAAQAPPEFSAETCIADFAARLGETDWGFGALHRENFTRSPEALVRWAPIAPELKRFDREIVENSIRFAWRDIRVELERRLDPEAVAADLLGGQRR